MRLALRAVAILAGLLFCATLHLVWTLFGGRPIWPQVFLGYAARCSGMKVRIEGVPLKTAVLVAANHVSWLDIFVLGGAAPVIFVARADMARWPLIGWAAGLNDTVFVNRDVRASVRDQADTLRDALAAGRAIGLFPEGTTDGGGRLLPFRASLFASLFPPMPGVRIQPVAIDYGGVLGEVVWAGDEGFGANAGRVLSRPGTCLVTLRFLDPIDPAVAGDRKRLAALTQAAVARSLAASAAPADPLYPAR